MSTLRDTPDNFQDLPGSTRYPMADLGELAVRLGAPSSIDRLGEVIFQDYMEDGLAPYAAETFGTGASVTVEDTSTFRGPHAISLNLGTAGFAYADIRRYFNLRSSGRIGLEVATMFYGNFKYLEYYCRFNHLPHNSYTQVDYWGTNGKLYIIETGNRWHYLDTISTYHGVLSGYHIIKVVCDFDREEYVRLIFDDHSYDLTGIPLNDVGSDANETYDIELYGMSNTGLSRSIRIGQIIITDNEP